MTQVFVSHSSKDQKVARTICTALEHRGVKCWIADRDVRPGENFQEAIVRAIRAAKVMVLVFTTNANNSDEIKKELALASQNRLTIIPVRVEDVIPNEAFAYEFATRQWIDLFADWENEVDRLCSRICAVVEFTPNTQTAATPVGDLQPRGEPSPIAELNRRIWSGTALATGLLLSDLGVFFAVLAVFFSISENYAAALPAFIAGLPLLIVGAGVTVQYNQSRIAGAILCGLLLVVIVAILVMPPQLIGISLSKSPLTLLGIFLTTSGLALLTKMTGQTPSAPQPPSRAQLAIVKLFGLLSKPFVFMAAGIYALPTWIIFFDLSHSIAWLVALMVCQLGLAVILFRSHRATLVPAPRRSVSA